MQSDYYLVAGVLIGGLAIPSLLSAWSDGRAPRAGAIMVMLSAGLIALAIMNSPTGYRLEQIPDVFIRVIGRIIN